MVFRAILNRKSSHVVEKTFCVLKKAKKGKQNMSRYNFEVKSIQETAAIIHDYGASIVRFGDGEVDIMMGHNIPYQDYSEALATELKMILQLPSNTVFLVGIPDVFTHLERYNPSVQSFWKQYLERYGEFYATHLTSSWYATTFLSRPYIDLAHKEEATACFHAIKGLWDHKDVLIVEGTTSRSGVGNDLVVLLETPLKNLKLFLKQFNAKAKINLSY